ncbi:MAG: SAM-dependent methyltransferase [Gammaproteobacteria bacterium]|nr:SAM-dependent methyltransferase [Gammaproteobacteria bacterium]
MITETEEDISRLPPPDAQAQAHSDILCSHIISRIDDKGSIEFADFMDRALYTPDLGYYAAGLRKFGKDGDFVTAPELASEKSGVFASCLAQQIRQIKDQLGSYEVLEMGAGSGALALGLMSALSQLDALPNHYFILETSAELKRRQQRTIARSLPQFADRVSWLGSLPGSGFRGVVVANEVLDAMPVQRFRVGDKGLELQYVAMEHGQFKAQWQAMDSSTAKVLERRLKGFDMPVGYESEINLRAEAWVRSMASFLKAGLILAIDYGFPRHEFYHPQRSEGTLMCHYRHRAHGDPLVLVGLQDITAHIDFTAMAEAADDSGLSVMGYTNQASFLIATGLEEIVAASDARDVQAHLRLTQQVKTLTSPSEMGELFKIIALGRDIEGPLRGFALNDMRGRL